MDKSIFDFCVGSADAGLSKKITALLCEEGFYSSGEAKSIPEFLRLLRLQQPWLAVVDARIPPGKIRQLASIIEEDALAAVLVINTGKETLNGYVQLNWPVESSVLAAVAGTLCLEFTRKKKLQQKIQGLEDKLQERKDIERAKGILMKHMQADEDKAYRYLQKKCMEKQISIGQMAREIIDANV